MAGHDQVDRYEEQANELRSQVKFLEEEVGLLRRRLSGSPRQVAVLEEKLRAYHEWRQRRDQALIAGAEPSVVVRTAGEWAASGFGLVTPYAIVPVAVLGVAINEWNHGGPPTPPAVSPN